MVTYWGCFIKALAGTAINLVLSPCVQDILELSPEGQESSKFLREQTEVCKDFSSLWSVIFANVLLSRTSHMANPDLRTGQ